VFYKRMHIQFFSVAAAYTIDKTSLRLRTFTRNFITIFTMCSKWLTDEWVYYCDDNRAEEIISILFL